MSCLNREAFTLATGQGTRTAMSDNRLGGEAIVVPNANKDMGGGITVNRKGGSRSKGRGGSNSRVNGDATDGLNAKGAEEAPPSGSTTTASAEMPLSDSTSTGTLEMPALGLCHQGQRRQPHRRHRCAVHGRHAQILVQQEDAQEGKQPRLGGG